MKNFARTHSRSDTDNPGRISINNCGRYKGINDNITVNRNDDRKDYQIIYIKHGYMEFNINGKNFCADDSSIIYIPKNVPHTYFYKAGTNTDYYWLHFAGDYADYLMRNTDLSKPVKIKKSCNISKIMNDIIHEIQLRPIAYTLSCTGKFLCLLSDIKRHADTPTFGTKDKIYKSAESMKSTYTENIPISVYAYRAGLEVHYYVKLFRDTIGASPLQYIQNLRIQYAVELLTDTDLSIAEIAIKCGFNSAMYLSRIFKKHMSISPAEYRNNLT